MIPGVKWLSTNHSSTSDVDTCVTTLFFLTSTILCSVGLYVLVCGLIYFVMKKRKRLFAFKCLNNNVAIDKPFLGVYTEKRDLKRKMDLRRLSNRHFVRQIRRAPPLRPRLSRESHIPTFRVQQGKNALTPNKMSHSVKLNYM